MQERTYIPRRRQMLGNLGAVAAGQLPREIPNCPPYYSQAVLPRTTTPGMIDPSGSGPPTEIPDTRERFHKFNSIATPAANTSNTLVTSFTTPPGHLAAVVGLLVHYEGTGFVEGDATMLFFSLRLNGAQFVSDYQTIPNTLGDLRAGPWPIPGRLKLYAGDLLEILVSIPLGSPIGTGAPNRCHGHLVGYYWPNTQ